MTLIQSTERLRESIEGQISSGNLSLALRLIQTTVDQVNCEPINVARIFGSKLLDSLCQRIGAVHLRSIDSHSDIVHAKNHPGNLVVYVASRLHPSGGHNSVLADMIRLSPSAHNVILLTGSAGPTNLASIRHHFKGTTEPTIELAPCGTHIQKLDWLQRRLLALAPRTVWLFNHHQDSVAIAAVQPDAGYRLRFYHHGDHHLCLGVHIAYAEHIDMNPFGFHNCRNALGILGNRYLPLTVRDQGVRVIPNGLGTNSNLVTCTAAGSNKISPPYFIRYFEVIPQLLRRTNGQHIHIGPLTKLERYRIRRRLQELGVPYARFIYIPFVESVWKTLHEYKVDLYVGSFPFGGARTMIEVMGAGIPLALHRHATSRILSCLDIADNQVIAWRTPENLYTLVQNISRESLIKHGLAGREKYEEYYREELLIHSLANWEVPTPTPQLLAKYTTDSLQRALDISSQVTFRGAFSRVVARMLQRLKFARA